MVDLELLKKTFDRDWVNGISNSYYSYVKFLKESHVKFNEEYFDNPGGWNNRHITLESTQYFLNILHPPNICILDYILKNFEEFKNFTYLDNGSGVGILSVFLSKLGLKCYNYDDFSQINHFNFKEYILKHHNLEISQAVNTLPTESDVLCCSSIWVNNPEFKNINFKYLLIDGKWAHDSSRSIVPEMTNYQLIDKYKSVLSVFKRKE